MRIDLKYGGGALPLVLPDDAAVDVYEPKAAAPLADPVEKFHAVLDAPLGCLPLEARNAPNSIAIAVPDETRPFPIKLLLPPLLDRIFAAWPELGGSNVTVIVGGGLHPPASPAQIARILPDDLRGCRIVAHDAEHSPMKFFGSTSRGTPVELNAAFGEADLKIVLGMVDTHQFVGFTGGSKGAVIGCASAAAIAANHAMLRNPAAVAGAIDDNPVRLDLNEAGEMAGIQFAVNVVLDAAKRPVAVLAGLPVLVMREASRLTGELYGLSFSEPYDIVVASCGGKPKDICLYQAQKGLNSAMQCAKKGGHILLLAECEQGIGDDVYYDYVSRFSSAGELMKTFEAEPFRMGAHKAYLFARSTTRYDVVIHSALPADILAKCLLTPGDMQKSVDGWLGGNKKARIAVLKNANSSFFTKV